MLMEQRHPTDNIFLTKLEGKGKNDKSTNNITRPEKGNIDQS